MRDLSEQVFRQLGIADRVEHDVRLDSRLETGAVDQLVFDYRYRNGFTTLMRRVSLTQEDDRTTWDQLHAASWAFRVAKKEQSKSRLVALVKRGIDVELAEAQLQVLRAYALPIDVADPNAATALGDALDAVTAR